MNSFSFLVKGFSLLETLLTVSIICILMVLYIPYLNRGTQKALEGMKPIEARNQLSEKAVRDIDAALIEMEEKETKINKEKSMTKHGTGFETRNAIENKIDRLEQQVLDLSEEVEELKKRIDNLVKSHKD